MYIYIIRSRQKHLNTSAEREGGKEGGREGRREGGRRKGGGAGGRGERVREGYRYTPTKYIKKSGPRALQVLSSPWHAV